MGNFSDTRRQILSALLISSPFFCFIWLLEADLTFLLRFICWRKTTGFEKKNWKQEGVPVVFFFNFVPLKPFRPRLHEQIKCALFAQIRPELLHTDREFEQLKEVLFAHVNAALQPLENNCKPQVSFVFLKRIWSEAVRILRLEETILKDRSFKPWHL